MNILGINAYHGDAAAALVQDGKLIAAIEEERFNRIKHWAGFPAESIRFCLSEGGIGVGDVEHVAVSFNPRANFAKRVQFVLSQRPSIGSVIDRLKRQGKVLGIPEQLAEACGCRAQHIKARIHHVEHHATHIASGFLVSPFDEAAVLSVDGMGDFVSTMTASAKGTSWDVLERVYYPHSLGFLYNAVTMYLGFPHYGDEYKVMGLAPYGEPEYLDLFRKIIYPSGDGFRLNLEYFTHHRDGIRMKWENGAPLVEPFYSEKLAKDLGAVRGPRDEVTPKHENIAKSLQAVTEEIIFHLLTRLHEKTGHENVCITGGCAMNSVANGKITLETPFKNAYIPVGAADNGTSFGAAFHVWCRTLHKPRNFELSHGYLGDRFSDEQCADAAREADLPATSYSDQSQLLDHVVDALCDGKVVGWFQGRSEFGARALGNRSLLADPRRTDMRDIINLKIKFREKFRPFAPSILEDYVSDYFEINDSSPFMEKVFRILPEKRGEIPAVTHVDGTGRLQSVSRTTNPLYYDLIARFRERTGVPIILNTSLNENEPIVRTPQQAISCFLRTAMDIIVVGNSVIDRTHPAFPAESVAAFRGSVNDHEAACK